MNDRILKHESVSRDTGMRQDTRASTWGRENHAFTGSPIYIEKEAKKKARATRAGPRPGGASLSDREGRLRGAVGRRHLGAVVAPYHGLHALIVK